MKEMEDAVTRPNKNICLLDGITRDCHFNRIPKEIRLWIFDRFSRNSMLLMGTVCKLWRHDLLEHDKPFEDFYVSQFRRDEIQMLAHPFFYRNVKTITIGTLLREVDITALEIAIGDRRREISVVLDLRDFSFNYTNKEDYQSPTIMYTIESLYQSPATMFTIESLIRIFRERLSIMKHEFYEIRQIYAFIKICEAYNTPKNIISIINIKPTSDYISILESISYHFPGLHALGLEEVLIKTIQQVKCMKFETLYSLSLHTIPHELTIPTANSIVKTLTKLRIRLLVLYNYNEDMEDMEEATMLFLEYFKNLKTLRVLELLMANIRQTRFLSFIGTLDKFKCDIKTSNAVIYLDILLSAVKMPKILTIIFDDDIFSPYWDNTVSDYPLKFKNKFPGSELTMDSYGFTLTQPKFQ